MASLYETLGVAKDADDAAIHKAYRRLSKKHHPDANGGSRANFDEISLAHRILMDAEARKHYDITGEIKERPAEGALDAEMFNLVMQTFLAVLNNTRDVAWSNIVDAMATVAKQNIAQIKQNMAQQDVALKKYEDVKARLTTKKEHNMFHALIDGQINGVKAQIGVCDQGIAQYERVATFLADYEYRVERREQGDFGRAQDQYSSAWQEILGSR